MDSKLPYVYPKPVMPKYFDKLEVVYPEKRDEIKAEEDRNRIEHGDEYQSSGDAQDIANSFNKLIASYPRYQGQPLLNSLKHIRPDKKLNLFVALYRTAEGDIGGQFFFTSFIDETVTIVGANLHPYFFTQFLVYTCFPKTINEASLERYEAAVKFVNEVFEITVPCGEFKRMIHGFLEKKNLLEIEERPAKKKVFDLFTQAEMQDLAKARVN